MSTASDRRESLGCPARARGVGRERSANLSRETKFHRDRSAFIRDTCSVSRVTSFSEERGISALLPLIGGLGILVGMLAAGVGMSTLQAARGASSGLDLAQTGSLDHQVMAEVAWTLNERVAASSTPLVAEDYRDMGDRLTSRLGREVAVSDESAKLNVNKMPYVLSRFMSSAGVSDRVLEELVALQADAMGLRVYKSRTNKPYAIRPDAQVGFRVGEEPPAPFHGWEQRPVTWGRRPLPPFRPLEDPRELVALWGSQVSYEILAKLVGQVTTVPVAGLNVNTAEEVALQAMMTWQADASLGHNRIAEYLDEFLPNPWENGGSSYLESMWGSDALQTVMGPDWRKAATVKKRWFEDRGLPPTAGAMEIVKPRFRHAATTSAKLVIRGDARLPPYERSRKEHPFLAKDLTQQLGVYAFLNPFYRLQHGEGKPLETVSIFLQGPGPYVATSGYCAVRIRLMQEDVDLVWHLSAGGPQRVVSRVAVEAP